MKISKIVDDQGTSACITKDIHDEERPEGNVKIFHITDRHQAPPGGSISKLITKHKAKHQIYYLTFIVMS
jgi:hypothetical protein